jgi:hypothetical protein
MSDEPDDYDIPLEGYELSLGNDLLALHGRFKELEAKLKSMAMDAKLKAMIADQINSTGDDPEIMAATRAEWAARAKAAEDKLAKAVEALSEIKSDLEDMDYNSAYLICKHIIAELTGGKDG